MPAPRWFCRFAYDRESTALQRRHDEPAHRGLIERIADEFANAVEAPGPVADLGCGPGIHTLALTRRGYDVVGLDGSPRMIEVARARAERDEVDARFDVCDVSGSLPFRMPRSAASLRFSSCNTLNVLAPSSTKSDAASDQAGTC